MVAKLDSDHYKHRYTSLKQYPGVTMDTAERVDLLCQPAPAQPSTVAKGLAAALEELGVKAAFGVVGGGVAPVAEAIAASSIPVYHFRHEGGAAFAATEASLRVNAPMVVFTTLGPGLTNSLTGLLAARSEGAKVVLISGLSAPNTRGRFALQETTYQSLPSTLFSDGPVFDFAETIEDASQLPVALTRLAQGISHPGGFVGHISIPAPLSASVADSIDFEVPIVSYPSVSPGLLETVVKLLGEETFWLWVGFGARQAAYEVRQLQQLTGAAVMSTPRGKGIFPESHPAYVGVTGMGGHPETVRFVERHRPAYALVLGTRLGEFTTFWTRALLPQKALIHVDVDRRVFGRSFPDIPTIGVHAEVRGFLRDLTRRLRERPRVANPRPRAALARPEVREQPGSRVRSAMLMQHVQEHVIDNTEALVLTEPGAAFSWGSHSLFFEEAGRYRSTMIWASMGHTTAGVVGAALATGQKAIAIVGDGALLMTNEISTAVTYGAPAVWIVLNNGEYGMVRHGMTAQRMTPVETQIGDINFAVMAHSLGAAGERVEHEVQLQGALQRALAAEGPYVVDVLVERDEIAPYMGRIESLMDQGVLGQGG